MPKNARSPIDAEDVRRLCGDIDDIKVAEIVATGAVVQELEEAFACTQGNTDVLADVQRPLAGRAAQIYDILTSEADPDEEV